MVLLERIKKHGLRIVVHAGALVPLAWLLWAYWQGQFLVDPVREITSLTGKTALILLVLSLACKPIHTLLGFRSVLRVRRALGMYAVLYASLHFLTFAWLDYGLDLGLLRGAILDQRYVLAGLAAGLTLLPLAITSTKGWQRRLGKGWKWLHRLVYLAGILAVVHFVWLVKDYREPLRYAVLLAVLLFLRIPRVRRGVSDIRHRLKARRESFVPGVASRG
jgi:sulfoxide reductase heme-binding subunit YedZ